MALYRSEAIVLRTRNLGEADRILTLYTREMGKRNVVAKGCRRPRSRLVGIVQPFSYIRVLVFEGKSLDTMSQGELVHAFSGLREDLLGMAYATYVAELVDQLIEEGEVSPGLFDLLTGTLFQMEEKSNLPLVTRYFEVHLMAQLGYRPHLENCIGCGGPVGEKMRFSIANGGLLCAKCVNQDPDSLTLYPATVQVMRRLLQWDPGKIGVMRPSPETDRQLEKVMRMFVDYRLQRELKSLDFLRSLEGEV